MNREQAELLFRIIDAVVDAAVERHLNAEHGDWDGSPDTRNIGKLKEAFFEPLKAATSRKTRP